MEFSAKQIAELIQGRVEGNPDACINTFAKIEEGKPGAISFLSNAKYINYIYDTESSVVLVDEALVLEKPVKATLIRVKSAYEAVAKLLQMYDSMKQRVSDRMDASIFEQPSVPMTQEEKMQLQSYMQEEIANHLNGSDEHASRVRELINKMFNDLALTL